MGGKNHQPCRNYLEESIKLSRALSNAYIELEKANVSFEDLLLQELNNENTSGGIEKIVASSNQSYKYLDYALDECANLRAKMVENDFVNLSTLATIDLNQLGLCLANQGIVEYEAWKTIAFKMQNGGFESTLTYIEQSIYSLKGKNYDLKKGFERLKDIVKFGDITEILEENLPENIKPQFAKLYTAWTKFNQEFLASSLISTELWYAENGYGSLTDSIKTRSLVLT